MKSKFANKVTRIHVCLLLLAVAAFVAVIQTPVTAKSLYVIADNKGPDDKTLPIQAYDIGSDGALTFQTEYLIPHENNFDAVGMAIDSDNGFLFITYERSASIHLLDARTMRDLGSVMAPGASDLAGIVYDHEKGRVYCVDRGQDQLYAYDWDPQAMTLTPVQDSPFTLFLANAYGIALDEIDDLLYVANANNNIYVYDTATWQRGGSYRIKLDRTLISVAVDAQRRLLYAGGGFAGNMFLTQYDLSLKTVKEVQVEPDAGVMGLAVDQDTGYVYLDTGVNNAPGGDNLKVYDTELNQIDVIHVGGSPRGLAIPSKEVSFNPLSLNKTVIRGASHSGASGGRPTVEVGDIVTYGIQFNNVTGDTVTDVLVVDNLPDEMAFVSADDDGVSGTYDPKSHTFTWHYSSLPPDIPMNLELAAQVKAGVKTGTIISNAVTISSKQTPPTTKRFDIITGHDPLNLTKTILGGVPGKTTAVKADEPVTYVIQFENTNDFAVTNVSVLDVLPEEVGFVSADKGETAGKYDPATHTCSWSFPLLSPGKIVRLELRAHVNEDLPKGTIFTNSVTVESKETPQSMATADAIVGENPKPTPPPLKILPEIIRRDGVPYDIQASIIFQEGITAKDIDANVLSTLRDADDPKAIEIKAKQQSIYSSPTRAKVVALFDKDELLNALVDQNGKEKNGYVRLEMTGMLTSGRTYSGETTVLITQYTGR